MAKIYCIRVFGVKEQHETGNGFIKVMQGTESISIGVGEPPRINSISKVLSYSPPLLQALLCYIGSYSGLDSVENFLPPSDIARRHVWDRAQFQFLVVQ